MVKIIFSFDLRIIKNGKWSIGTWKCDWIGLSYSLGQSRRGEEILGQGKGPMISKKLNKELYEVEISFMILKSGGKGDLSINFSTIIRKKTMSEYD